MKLIIAIIRPERLQAVQDALRRALDEGDNFRLTVCSVDGHGRQSGDVEFFRGQALPQRLVQKTQITLGVNDRYAEPAVQAIISAARTGGTGEVGDGKVFVLPMDDCVRIRTGERGGGAI